MKTVIIDACRTPIGKFQGSLASETAVDLGRQCLQNLLTRVEEKIPPESARQGEEDLLKRKPFFKTVYPQKKHSEETAPLSPVAFLVEEAIIGNVLSAGQGQNPARQVILPSLSRRVPATTLNQVCASGMKAVVLADTLITSGVNQVMIAGGVESMSQAPHIFPARQTKSLPPLGNWVLEDTIMKDGLKDAFHDYPMGITAENLAQEWKISREEQDEFAYYSQQKAALAEQRGRFTAERFSYQGEKVDPKTGKSISCLDHDEFIRHDVDLTKLTKLKPAFISGDSATVTAGNASGINDGAAFLYLMSDTQSQSWGCTPLATIVDSVTVALDETVMGYTPKIVIEELLRRNRLQWEELASVEINEAFAVQTLAVLKDLGVPPKEYNHIDHSRVNPWGGAIALGHPIGCSGARIITTLAHTLQSIKASGEKRSVYGIAALCVGGGQGCGVVLQV